MEKTVIATGLPRAVYSHNGNDFVSLEDFKLLRNAKKESDRRIKELLLFIDKLESNIEGINDKQ